jgi:signal transduction histidine kinase/DNA-binding response OmpR family regulator
MLGRNPRLLQSGKTSRKTYAQMWRQLSAGQPWRGLLFNRRKDGVEYVEDATITPMRDAQGRVTQYLALMLDVTEKRRMTEELERHQLYLTDMVEQRTVALVEARHVAEAASHAKSAFLATMSHEIRTPMNGVVGSIELLQRSMLSAYQRDLTDTVSESALALLTIIDDILDFSKIEAGKLKLVSEPVSLVRLTDSVCDALRITATSNSVDLQVDVAPGVPDWILSDAVRLRQILNNLLGNAIRFSARDGRDGRDGRVVLQVQPCGPDMPGHIQLCVIDNGIGMAPEALERIFQPFVQAESATTRRFGGTGLGLSICERLAALMDGRIGVDSVLDQGSTFTVTLPFQSTTAPQRVVDDKPATATQMGRRFAPAGGQLVLVAEDNAINQKVIGHQLALLGLSAEMVDDGMEALARWRAGRATRRHALLLTDLNMPGMDGYTLASTIRSEELGGSRLPIVALSANALQGEIDRCRSAGMDDYLSKPVQIDRLGEMLKRWLLPDQVQAPAVFERVDSKKREEPEVEPSLCDYDERALERFVGDDPAVLADFRQRFALSALRTMGEMRLAARHGEFATLSNLAHRFKSSARAVGAVSLGACCDRIERAQLACGAAQMQAQMAMMEEAFAHVVARLSEHTGVGYLDEAI